MADEFIAWAIGRPDRLRWELVDGQAMAMAPERAAHGRIKLRLAARLDAAAERASLPCEVFGDGMAVQVDEATVYEPDAMLRCGAPLPGDAVKVTDPLIVVEVVSLVTVPRHRGQTCRLLPHSVTAALCDRPHTRSYTHPSQPD